MRNLICWCSETQQPVNLQIYTDYVTLALIWSNPVHFECPHCGAKHETKVGAACLQTTPSPVAAIFGSEPWRECGTRRQPAE
jgi:hypothetical protein